jgi:pyruvate-ferredoxin/flavodoxin oxidoreductase
LFRYRPDAEQPMHLDSGAPTIPLKDFELTESRFASLARSAPERSAELLELAQSDVDTRWRHYQQLAEELHEDS